MAPADGAAARGNVGGLFLLDPWVPILPFKLNQHRRHRIPKQKHKVMNSLGALLRSWREYDASLRQRGSLTVWFTDEAIEGWRAALRTTPGGQLLESESLVRSKVCAPLPASSCIKSADEPTFNAD